MQVWPERVAVHFYFIVIMVGFQVIGGLMYYPVTGSLSLVCPLTVLMQYVRGNRLDDPLCYRYSFVLEFFQRLHLSPRKKSVTVVVIFSVILVSVQYFFGFPFAGGK